MKTVAVLAPTSDRDGIADYTKDLYSSIKPSVKIISLDKTIATSRGLGGWIQARKYFKNLANECNEYPLVHIQHEYSFFGQLSPLYNYHRVFFNHLKSPYLITLHEVPPRPVGIVRHPRSLVKRIMIAPYNFTLNLLTRSSATESFMNYGLMKRAAVVYVHHVSQQKILAKRGLEARQLPFGLNVKPAPQKIIGKTIHLGCFGFINPRKGYDLAIEALALLPDKYRLIIIGGVQTVDGLVGADHEKYEAKLKDLIRIKSLSSRVTITGYLDKKDAQSAINDLDIGLAPFESMSGSASIASFLGSSKLVVASDLAEVRELVNEGAAIVPFSPHEPGALADQIVELVDDGKISGLVKGGQKYLRDHDFKTVAAKLLTDYRNIVRP